MPLTYRAQRSLLTDLINSFLTALLLIFVSMSAYLRSVSAGLVAMLPNIFPTVLLFGLTSLGGMEVNIGAVMTASVALGIAVDDTLHYVTWFRRELVETGSRYVAVRRAYGHCASAMVQSTLICGLGLLVYTLSPFIPTQRFALMMLLLLLAALAGDLLLLPALLLGPMGEWLRPRHEPY
jgi:predicted RND superfamily exporter protein